MKLGVLKMTKKIKSTYSEFDQHHAVFIDYPTEGKECNLSEFIAFHMNPDGKWTGFDRVSTVTKIEDFSNEPQK